eukprot:scaffold865_cov312-Prasinococcus_capsulatus_cf.AAC.8
MAAAAREMSPPPKVREWKSSATFGYASSARKRATARCIPRSLAPQSLPTRTDRAGVRGAAHARRRCQRRKHAAPTGQAAAARKPHPAEQRTGAAPRAAPAPL